MGGDVSEIYGFFLFFFEKNNAIFILFTIYKSKFTARMRINEQKRKNDTGDSRYHR